MLVAAALAATPASGAQAGAEVEVTIAADPIPWKERARLAIDRDGLQAALAAGGHRVSANALYLVEIVPGVDQPAFVLHDAGGGAFWKGFYPLSAVKLAAAVAAIDWVAELGFTGDAIVRFDDGFEATVSEIYEQSITVSANWAYDRTLQIAGLDYVNQEVLPRFGLESMWLGAAYAGSSVQNPPGYTLLEEVPIGPLPAALPATEVGSTRIRHLFVPGRTAGTDYRGWNDTDLFDLVEVLRRVMLDGELPHAERFGLPAADVQRLQAALCRATPVLLAPGVAEVLGPEARVCNKTGIWPSGTCVDHAYIDDGGGRRRLLLAAVAPCNWPLFSSIAAETLAAVDRLSGVPLQEDAGRPIEATVAVEGEAMRIELSTAADWALLWIDDGPPMILAGDRLRASLDIPAAGDHLLVVMTVEHGSGVGYRALGLEVTPGA